MTTAQLAAADQAEARQRETDRKVQRFAARFLAVFVLLAVYSMLAAYGVVPAAPWSPLGQ